VNIADDSFLAALIEKGVDTDGDGKISPEEAEVIISLDVSEKSISDLTGIEAFINLDTLDCSFNQLTSLDVSKIIYLKYLKCNNNKLYTLDVSNNTNLTDLNCSNNYWLTSLDISNNSKLGPGEGYFIGCYLGINNMPGLEKVCVWTMPFPPEGLTLCAFDGSPNVYFTTDCN